MNFCEQQQTQVIKTLQGLETWEDRYRKIIEFGKGLAPLSESEKNEANKIKGCQSQVWLVPELKDGKVLLRGDSDAVLVKGLVALVIQIYSGGTPDEILSTPPQFLKEAGLESHLTPSRSNGLSSMLKQIQYFALAYKTLLSQKR
ncbi:MAG: SufE family protein [Proteobacteria bacterium]|jgi:cysteine desulfuration protein SufE|nr:SufE family protein [Pseudomonadota bacterium]